VIYGYKTVGYENKLKNFYSGDFFIFLETFNQSDFMPGKSLGAQ